MRYLLLSLVFFLTGCEVTPPPPSGSPPAFVRSAPSASAAYRRTVARVEPVARTLCRQQNPDFPPIACDFEFSISTNPRLGLNAFQTIKRNGQPQVIFTLALLRTLQNDDEVAFIVGHETAHQISRHILKSSAQQQLGAVLLGGLVAGTGRATTGDVNRAASLGALIGSRAYSKQFELEADIIATFILIQTGYDPVRGAAPFARMETGSSGFLATHPPSRERFEAVRNAAARINADRRAGRPARIPR